MNTDFFEDRVRVFLEHLKDCTIAQKKEVSGFLYKPCGYKKNNIPPIPDNTFSELLPGEKWNCDQHEHAWFYKKLEIPESMRGKDIVLSVHNKEDGWYIKNPQFIAYLDGKICQGLDMYHRQVYLDSAKSGYELYLYAYSAFQDEPVEICADLIEYDKTAEKLYYTLKVAYETAILYHPEEKIYADIEKHVCAAINMIDLRKGRSKEFIQSAEKALSYLEKNLSGKKASDINVICIGHTHVDVAWFWTLAQTREKVQRSFSNVIALMKKYPEYRFMSSQAQLYKYLKEEAPDLYEEVKKLVREGRWEVEGAMWVEADCNLSSGESLVRQILYGKRFFMEEFGVDCRVLWLPDVFGYSAAMPQILKKSGIDKFVTSKIAWNETNRIPYDMFFWHGIDGTDIFTYFLTAQSKIRGHAPTTECTYNAVLSPSFMQGTYDRFQQKSLTDEVLVTFGYGDGGGGPTKDQLDTYDVMKNGFSGCNTPKQEFAGAFLDRMKTKAEKQSKTPHWYGELYLEYHRGTYTSMAKNKWYNRKCEFLLQNTEALSVTAQKLAGLPYPKENLYDSWETLLLNQFHDIIPGSSIKEVYDDSWAQYEEITKNTTAIAETAKKAVSDKISTDGGILVFNPNGFETDGTVTLDGKTVFVRNIPAHGYRVVKDYCSECSVKVSENTLENRFFKLTLDKKGTFRRIFDKKNKRDILKPSSRGNVLMAYEDLPRSYDNWEISNYYSEKSWEIDEVVSSVPVYDGARAGIRIIKKFLDSTLTQTIWLYDQIARIDIENDIDWKESHLVVKAEFPVDINSTRATYDIQFGNIERPTHTNTSWDAAKFEVCAHKFADLSEYDYGVSLLNDCKYGYDIHSGVMKITLLKCGTHPNPEADKCHHEFTYSLYPHAGDFRQAETVKQSYLLNCPLTATVISKQSGDLPESYSLITCDKENIITETVKQSEDKNGTVIRMYECFNKKSKAALSVGFDFSKAYICDMMENTQKELDVRNGKILLDFKPFEIITIKLI